MRVKIKVTQADIKKGQAHVRKNLKRLDPQLTRKCAVALAVQRTFNDPTAVWRFGCGDVGEKLLEAVRRKLVNDWIEKHDALEVVKPFNFLVEVVD